MLAERGHKVAAMIELDVPEDELMKRLLLRGQQSGRSDDNEETIKKRLNVYHNQTSPLIDGTPKKAYTTTSTVWVSSTASLATSLPSSTICNIIKG